MADETAGTWLDLLTTDERYWLGELSRHGLTLSQAEVLACQHGVDRHSVREALIAARANGTDPAHVFDCFS